MRQILCVAAIATAIASGTGCSSSEQDVAATPTFSPPPGTYNASQQVTLSCTTPGAVIHYTTDGSVPTSSSPTYTTPIVVASSTTVQAIAVASGFIASGVATTTYAIQLPSQTATPTFSPAPGMYASSQSVALSCTTPGATIYYTTDGSAPTKASAVYAGPITVSSTTTINARAAADGFTASGVASGMYTITPATPTAQPTFSPGPGTYTSTQFIALSCATPGATIYYTFDGSTPTTSSRRYDAPIETSYSLQFRAIAVASGFAPSDVAAAAYTIQRPSPTATPAFFPPPGMYSAAQSVTLTSATANAQILYTTDGSLPSIYSHPYSGPITVSSTTTIMAVAWVSSGSDLSELATGTYTLDAGVCTDGAMKACYTGPHWTLGVGTCHGGQQTCVGGQWGACAGEQVPIAELCNSHDDDCNGVPDDGPFGVRDGNPACASTVLVNAPMSGDSGTATARLSGYGEQWSSQTFTENDGASRDLTGTIRLVNPYGCDFDLFVYCDGYGGGPAGASLPDYYGHTTYVRAADRDTADDTFTVVIEVRYVSCAPGSIPGSQVCGNWTLDISGNTSAAASAPVCP